MAPWLEWILVGAVVLGGVWAVWADVREIRALDAHARAASKAHDKEASDATG